jgi:hypothetical protein
MRNIDAGGKTVDVGVAIIFGFEKASASSENHVGAVQELALGMLELRWRKLEVREFIHAVVDNRFRVDVTREAVHQRGVEPQHWLAPAKQGENLVEQPR